MRASPDRVPMGPAPAFVAVAAIVALAAALRFHDAGSQLWYDEIRTLIGSVREPLGVIVTHFPSNNDHVFYSVLAKLSIVAGGETPFTIRLPAVLFGIVSVLLIYSFGRQVAGRFEAASAALLAAVSYHHVWFSQNARGYTILLAVTLLSTQLLLMGLRSGKRWPFILFGIVCAFGAYTHLTMVLAVVGQALVVAAYLLARDKGFVLESWVNPAIGFVVAGLATIALYLPLLGDVSAFFGDASTTPKAATAGWALLELVRGLQVGYASGAVMVVAGAVFLVGCVSYLRQSPMVLALFIAPGAVVYLTSLLLSRPTFPRFFFFLAGFALLIVVRGVAVITEFGARVIPGLGRFAIPLQVLAVAAMVAVLALDLPRAYAHPKQDYAGALAFVTAQARPGDSIVIAGNGAAYPYRHYYGKPWPRLMSAADLAAVRARGRPVWVLHTFERYMKGGEGELFTALKAGCAPVRKFPGTLADGDIHVSRCEPAA